MQLLKSQYQFVCEAREVVFHRCDQLTPQQFVEEISQQGASIRHLQVHVANAYIHWLGKFALGYEPDYYEPAQYTDVTAVKRIYTDVNELMNKFLSRFYKPEEIIRGTLPGRGAMEFSVLRIFTHVVTHEFHHKGQLMSMLRHLGHIPPDADIIRF